MLTKPVSLKNTYTSYTSAISYKSMPHKYAFKAVEVTPSLSCCKNLHANFLTRLRLLMTGMKESATKILSIFNKSYVNTDSDKPINQQIDEIKHPYKKIVMNVRVFDSNFSSLNDYYDFIAEKISIQTGEITSDDINDMVQRISTKMNIPKKTVLKAMSKLTQFGSYRSLMRLGKALEDLNALNLYATDNLSLNKVLDYVGVGKNQFNIYTLMSLNRQGFILDDNSLSYLENMNDIKKEKFKQRLSEGKIILINLDGTGFKLGNQYLSYTCFDGGQNLEKLTEAVLRQASKSSLDNVLNGSYIERVRKLFGDTAVENIKNINLENNMVDADIIAEQIKPNIPDSEYIERIIDNIYEYEKLRKYEEGCLDNKIEQIPYLIANYYAKMVNVFSNDTLAYFLKNKYIEIMETADKLGIRYKDIFYIIPDCSRSFSVINYMYAKINNIPMDKFVYTNGESKNNIKLPSEKGMFVILDDISATGATMVYHVFHYLDFKKHNPHAHVAFAPLVCTEKARSKIDGAIQEVVQKNGNCAEDVLLPGAIGTNPSFSEEIPLNYADIMHTMHTFTLGFRDVGMCTSFPYMIPDTSSSFAEYLLRKTLNNPDSLLANKVLDLLISDIYRELEELPNPHEFDN